MTLGDLLSKLIKLTNETDLDTEVYIEKEIYIEKGDECDSVLAEIEGINLGKRGDITIS